MFKRLLILIFSGMLASACVPGPELKSPAVQGTVYDARTTHPLPGATISVTKTDHHGASESLTAGVSDSKGRFSLPARYGFGLVLLYGDPASARVTVKISKPGYRSFASTDSYNFYTRPHQSIHVDAPLNPGRNQPPESQTGQLYP